MNLIYRLSSEEYSPTLEAGVTVGNRKACRPLDDTRQLIPPTITLPQ
jgi:hypothetical protein